jgi:hypothetical protein
MKTFTLNFQKVPDPVSQKQIAVMCDFDELKGCPSASQMLKRLDQSTYTEIMHLLESGYEVKITG